MILQSFFRKYVERAAERRHDRDGVEMSLIEQESATGWRRGSDGVTEQRVVVLRPQGVAVPDELAVVAETGPLSAGIPSGIFVAGTFVVRLTHSEFGVRTVRVSVPSAEDAVLQAEAEHFGWDADEVAFAPDPSFSVVSALVQDPDDGSTVLVVGFARWKDQFERDVATHLDRLLLTQRYRSRSHR